MKAMKAINKIRLNKVYNIFMKNKSITVREALNSAMDEELERDPNVFIMGEEVA